MDSSNGLDRLFISKPPPQTETPKLPLQLAVLSVVCGVTRGTVSVSSVHGRLSLLQEFSEPLYINRYCASLRAKHLMGLFLSLLRTDPPGLL